MGIRSKQETLYIPSFTSFYYFIAIHIIHTTIGEDATHKGQIVYWSASLALFKFFAFSIFYQRTIFLFFSGVYAIMNE